MSELCNTLPPKEIYDVLNLAESKGIKIPESVDSWWVIESIINENKREEGK